MALPRDPVDLAYIAGLFDGEGCITRANGRTIVQVGMTDREVIEYLGSLGGTVRIEHPPGNRQTLYRWRLLARLEVLEFLAALRPFLRVKAREAARREDELLALERVA